MSLDLGDLGVIAAELMERLEEDYADKESARLGVVAVIAEVEWDDGDSEITAVEYRCSDGRRWVQSGLFTAAERGVRYSSENPHGNDEE
jgi:hypothetical protein